MATRKSTAKAPASKGSRAGGKTAKHATDDDDKGAARGDHFRARFAGGAADVLAQRLQGDASAADVGAALAAIPTPTLPDPARVVVDTTAARAPLVVDDEAVRRRAFAKRAAAAARPPRGRGEPVSSTDAITVTVVAFADGTALARASVAGLLLDDQSDPSRAVRAQLEGCPVGESRFITLEHPSAVRVDAALATPPLEVPDDALLALAREDEEKALRAQRLFTLERAVMAATIRAAGVVVPAAAVSALAQSMWGERAAPLHALGLSPDELEAARSAFVDDGAVRDEAGQRLGAAKIVEAYVAARGVTVVEDDVKEVVLHLRGRLGVPLKKLVDGLAADPVEYRKMLDHLRTLKAIEGLTREVVGDALVDELRGRRAVA